jgi:hypothetical protein
MGGVFVAVMCILSIIGLVIGMIVTQAENAIVLEDLGLLAGLSRGWQIFTTNLLTVILVALILGVIGWVAGLLIALPMLAVIVPAGIGLAVSEGKNVIVPLALGAGCCLLYLPVLLILSGILQTYTQSVWTLAFRRMTAAPVPVAPEQIIPGEVL